MHLVEVGGRIRVVADERFEHGTHVAAARLERHGQPLPRVRQQRQHAHERRALPRIAPAAPALDEILQVGGRALRDEQQPDRAGGVVDAPRVERPVDAERRERRALGVDRRERGGADTAARLRECGLERVGIGDGGGLPQPRALGNGAPLDQVEQARGER